MNALHGMPESRTHLDQAGHLEDWFGLSCLVLAGVNPIQTAVHPCLRVGRSKSRSWSTLS